MALPYSTVCYAETNECIYAWSLGLVALFTLFCERVYRQLYEVGVSLL